METINKNIPKNPVQAVLFDFDGTFSLLRDGWEEVMFPLMAELLGAENKEMIREYIGESTGIQTIHQMKWLAEQVQKRTGNAQSPWDYKAEYNRRLMETVTARRKNLISPETYLVLGTLPLIRALYEQKIEMYVASGTDDPDVIAEAQALGIAQYFTRIAGAPLGAENCAKEDVIRQMLSAGFPGEKLAVVGDGKVEIAIGREAGARTLGIAKDEETRIRLLNAGADAIAKDFSALDEIMAFLLGGRTK
jgi:phosphoglycolate phosphatase-like HAD superfamily hydrolase